MILNAIVTILPSSCDFSFDCLCGAPVGGLPLSHVYGCSAASRDFVFSQLSAHPSTPPSCKVVAQRTQNSLFRRILKLSQCVRCLPQQSSCGWLIAIYDGNLTLRKGNTQTSCGLLVLGSYKLLSLTISFRDGNISKVHSCQWF